ncbi:unnamed protein product [Symbiodinium sp. KB8]|nr:unnamed protein product [Symbiodinium sp. KB8]
MAMNVEVGLLSGKTATVTLGVGEDVETLTRRAQTALGVGRGRLLDSAGNILDDQPKNVRQIQTSYHAFAGILGDGSIVTWGHAEFGGDSSAVQDQLKNVQQIQATGRAFAAFVGDGSVVTWDFSGRDGDGLAEQQQLRNVRQIQASRLAFAAVLETVQRIISSVGAFHDGSVVTWGAADLGGDSSLVQDQLKNVQQIAASGGQLRNVQQIQACDSAFAALLDDGSIEQLTNVQQIEATERAFAAILCDGCVVTWGNADHGGDSSAVQHQLKDVLQIRASHAAFAAFIGNGSVVTWAYAEYGGDSSAVLDQLEQQH